MKKVLLINPNNMTPPVAPLALEYISSFLQEKGHKVLIYDVNINKENLSSVLEKETPNLVGITVRNIDDSCYATSEFLLDGIKGQGEKRGKKKKKFSCRRWRGGGG